MFVVPAATAVTRPVEDTEATEVLEDVQGLVGEGVSDPVNCVVKPIQTLCEPVMVGSALIVTDVVALIVHPLPSVTVTVYVPVAPVEALGIVGFCWLDVKLFGPDHE